MIEEGLGGQLVEEAGIYPKEPTLAREDFEKIRRFYIAEAPDQLELPESVSLPATNQFELVNIEERFDPPMGTMIRSFPHQQKIIYSDAKADYCSIELLDNDFKLIQSLAVPKPVSAIQLVGDTLIATSMGQFTPNDAPSGSIFKIFKQEGQEGYSGFFNVIKNLQRPVYSTFGDLNQDGREDVVVCEYGNHTGNLTWYENAVNGQYLRHVLWAQPGASKAVIQDFDQDGRPDIMALMAQGDEGIDIHYNLGDGQFSRQRVLRFSPLYGSITFQLQDANDDGFLDILHVNGDNADYSIVDKPYHGVRLFLNNGSNEFAEAYFYPMPGAYDAHLTDFDRDGDLDIAAISFFPGNNDPENGFVYLENEAQAKGTFEFAPYRLPGTEIGRWIRMDVHDRDGDGFDDITLLSFTGMELTNDQNGQFQKWLTTSPSILHLKNIGKKRAE